jgi:mannitol-specific phosphotransferase system IIBC component
MLGYFILKENAERLGLLNSPEIRNELQQTYFVVTERDVVEHLKREVSPIKFDTISNYLNKNYFESIVGNIAEQIK